MSGLRVMPLGSNRTCSNLLTSDSTGTPYCSADRDQRGDGVHQAADRAAFLGHGDEDFAGRAVFVEADGDVAFVAGDVELVRERVARVGQPAAQRALDDALDDLLDDPRVLGRCGSAMSLVELGERLATSRATSSRRGFDIFLVFLVGFLSGLRPI